jgi:hypothetical protein
MTADDKLTENSLRQTPPFSPGRGAMFCGHTFSQTAFVFLRDPCGSAREISEKGCPSQRGDHCQLWISSRLAEAKPRHLESTALRWTALFLNLSRISRKPPRFHVEHFDPGESSIGF